MKQDQPNPAEPDTRPTVNQSQNLLTVHCGLEKEDERMDVKKEVKKEECADHLKRPAGDPEDDDPVIKRLRRVRKDLEDSTCILETLTTALTRGGIDPEDQVVGATPKWIPPPQQAPQPPQAQAQASQPAPQQVPVVPVKAMPTQPAPKPPLHNQLLQPKHHNKQPPKHLYKQQPKHPNKHLLLLGHRHYHSQVHHVSNT